MNDSDVLSQYKIEETKFVVLMVTKVKTAAVPETTSTNPNTSSSASASKPAETKAEGKPADASQTNKASKASGESALKESSGEDSGKSSSVQTQAESQLVTGSELESVINNIVEMGYERADVQRALQASFNNPQRAVEYLISGMVPVEDQIGELGTVGSQDSDSASQSAGSDSSHPLEVLRSLPQYQQMCQLLRQNPELLDTMMQQLRSTNPQLLDLIRQNQSAFVQMVNENNMESTQAAGVGAAQSDAVPASDEEDESAIAGLEGTVTISPSDREAIDRLKALGFPEYMVVQVYFACDKNENMAANFLLSSDN